MAVFAWEQVQERISTVKALQYIRNLFNNPAIVALKEWRSPNGGEIGVYESREHVYLLVYDVVSQGCYMHPYNPDLREKALTGAAVIAAVATAEEVDSSN